MMKKISGKDDFKYTLSISNIKIIKLQKMMIHLPHPRFLHIRALKGSKIVEIPIS
jgi:hypothetical protein